MPKLKYSEIIKAHFEMELVLIPEDFHSRENWWAQSSIATQFIQQFPLEEMKSMDELVNDKGAFCIAPKQ